MMSEETAREITNNQTQGDQNQSAKAPRVPSDGGYNYGQKYSDNTKRDTAAKKHDALDWVNLVVLVLTFGAAVAAAFEAARLADLTQELAVDGRRIADRQARLVASSAKVSSDTMINSSRAWVSPRELGIGDATLGVPLLVNLSYVNVGKEPALNLTVGDSVYMRLHANLLSDPAKAAEAIGDNKVCEKILVPPSTETVGITVWPNLNQTSGIIWNWLDLVIGTREWLTMSC
jgi:hypothetical protein